MTSIKWLIMAIRLHSAPVLLKSHGGGNEEWEEWGSCKAALCQSLQTHKCRKMSGEILQPLLPPGCAFGWINGSEPAAPALGAPPSASGDWCAGGLAATAHCNIWIRPLPRSGRSPRDTSWSTTRRWGAQSWATRRTGGWLRGACENVSFGPITNLVISFCGGGMDPRGNNCKAALQVHVVAIVCRVYIHLSERW